MIATTSLFLAQAAASAEGTPAPNALMQLFPLVILAVLFYFLLIRPQQKRQKEHAQLLGKLKVGDKVVTSSGIHGLIANVKERIVVLKVADNVKIEFDKSAIAAVINASDETKA